MEGFLTLDGLFTLGSVIAMLAGVALENIVIPWVYARSAHAKRRRERERDQRILEIWAYGS